MNKYIPELTDKVYELYKTYESFVWNDLNKRIVIVFEAGNIISFYLYNLENGAELIDDVHLSFSPKETNLYYALAIRLFVKTLGNVMIHKLSDDMFYNPTHRHYLLYVVKNKELYNMIHKLVMRQENEVICLDTDIVDNVSNSVKHKIYSKKFLNEIDNRTKLTSAILRNLSKDDIK